MNILERPKLFYLYLVAIILNILISYSLLFYRQPFNVDGIYYLHAAEVYANHGLHAAMQIYPWPFYSVMITKISQLTHLSLLSSAYLLDVILTSILVCFFLKVISACGGTFVHQGWGLVIILLYPFLNHDRINILRDFGYYAFFIVSLWYFIKFLQQNKIYYALLWQIAMLIASMFRIEGVVLLLLVPLITTLMPQDKNFRERGLNYLKLMMISILLLVIIGCIFPKFLHFGRIAEIFNNLQISQIIVFFQQKIEILRDQVLGVLARDGALWFLMGGIAGVFLAALIGTLGVFSTLLLVYGAHKKIIHIDSAAKKGLFIYSISVTLILIGFVLHQLFLSERYVMPLVLLLMLALVFIVKSLYELPKMKFKILVIIFLLINTISSFGHFGVSKSYVVDAGEWAATHIPATNKLVYINDAQIAYYANRMETQSPLILENLKNYQYIIINIKHDEKSFTEQQLVKIIGKSPDKIFQNKRGDKAIIFMAISPAGPPAKSGKTAILN